MPVIKQWGKFILCPLFHQEVNINFVVLKLLWYLPGSGGGSEGKNEDSLSGDVLHQSPVGAERRARVEVDLLGLGRNLPKVSEKKC